MDEEELENWSFPTNFNKYSVTKPKSRLGFRRCKYDFEVFTHPVTPGRSLEAKQGQALRDIANIIQESNPILNDSFINDSSSSITEPRQSLLSETLKTPGRSFYMPWAEDSPLDPLQGIVNPPTNPSYNLSPASAIKKNQVHKTLFGKSNDCDDSLGIVKMEERKNHEESMLELTCDSEQPEKNMIPDSELKKRFPVDNNSESLSVDKTGLKIVREVYSEAGDFRISSHESKICKTSDTVPSIQCKNNDAPYSVKSSSSFDILTNDVSANFVKKTAISDNNNHPPSQSLFHKFFDSNADNKSTPLGSGVQQSKTVVSEPFHHDKSNKKIDEVNDSLVILKKQLELKSNHSLSTNKMPVIPLGWSKKEPVPETSLNSRDCDKRISSADHSYFCDQGNKSSGVNIAVDPIRSYLATSSNRESHTEMASHLKSPYHNNLRLCKTQDNIPNFLSSRNDIPHSMKPIPGIDKITQNISSLFTKSISKPCSLPNNSQHSQLNTHSERPFAEVDLKANNHLPPERMSAYPMKVKTPSKLTSRETIKGCDKVRISTKGSEVNHLSEKIHHSFPHNKTPIVGIPANRENIELPRHGLSSQENICNNNAKSKLLIPQLSEQLPTEEPVGCQSFSKPSHLMSLGCNRLAYALSDSNYSTKPTPSIDQIDGRCRNRPAPVKSIFQASPLKNKSSFTEGTEVNPLSNIFHSSIIKQHPDDVKHHQSLPNVSKDDLFKRPTLPPNNIVKTMESSILKNSLSEIKSETPISGRKNQENPDRVQPPSLKSNGMENALPVKTQDQAAFKKPAIVRHSTRQNHNIPDQLFINNSSYQVLSLLGQGGSSKVYQALDEASRMVAIKCVDLMSVDQTVATGYLNEVHLLSVLQSSDSVIKMHNHEYKEKNRKLFVVMEVGDIDFSSLIKSVPKNKRMPIHTIIYYWIEMLQCVHDIHEKGVIHSDLKPANFLLVKGRLKLIDFGIASSLQDDMTSVVKEITTGTFNYMSPEAIVNYSNTQRGHKISYKSDVWSLGCILYQLIYGRTPYSHITHMWSKMHAIGDPKCEPSYPSGNAIPFALDGALRWCLIKDPKLRPTTKDLLTLPYFPPTEDTHWGVNIRSQLLAHTTQMLPAFSFVDMK